MKIARQKMRQFKTAFGGGCLKKRIEEIVGILIAAIKFLRIRKKYLLANISFLTPQLKTMKA